MIRYDALACVQSLQCHSKPVVDLLCLRSLLLPPLFFVAIGQDEKFAEGARFHLLACRHENALRVGLNLDAVRRSKLT